MQDGPNLSGRADTTVSALVKVAGAIRDTVSVDLRSQCAGEVPAVDGPGIMAASGTIEWAPSVGARESDPAHSSRILSPWRRLDEYWPPRGGDPITIDFTVSAPADPARGLVAESVTCRVFTGRILSTSGAVGEPLRSEIVDNTDDLNIDFRMRPLLWCMPQQDMAGGEPITTQISPMTLIEWGLLTAGFNVSGTYLGQYAQTLIYIPGQGSFFPRVGKISKEAQPARGRPHPQPIPSKWGAGTIVANRGNSTQLSVSVQSRKAWGGPQKTPLEVTVNFPGEWKSNVADPGDGRAENDYECDLFVRPRRCPDFVISRSTDGTSISMAKVNSNSLDQIGGSIKVGQRENVRAAVRLEASGNNVTARLRVLRQDGSSQETSGALGGVINNSALLTVEPQLGAFGLIHVADYPPDKAPWDSLNQKPKAIIDTVGANRSLAYQKSIMRWWAMPRWPGQGETGTVLELIKEASTALNAAVWLDELGRFRWRDPPVFPGEVESYVSSESLLELDWAEDFDRARSSVTVDWKKPAIQGGPQGTRPWAYFGEADPVRTNRDDAAFQVLVKPTEDEDWIVPDTSWEAMGPSLDPYQRNWINRGETSFICFTFEDGTPDSWDMSSDLAVVEDETFEANLRVSVQGGPSEMQVGFVVPDDSRIWAGRRGRGTPQIYGWGKVRWADRAAQQINSTTAGAPTFRHNGAFWYQSDETASESAFYMGNLTQGSRLTVKSVKISPDIRIQLQDRVEIIDPDAEGIAIRGAVVGKRMSLTAGKLTQDLELDRIVGGWDDVGTTYAELDRSRADQNYGANDSDAAGRNYADYDKRPLKDKG